jgi:DNA (cytosine-5)-methyltransferase 1
MSALTLTDLFAGFGGASSGAVQVPGIELVIAANHWPLAVEVHNSNHPTADHACVDLHLEDPGYFPSTDLLWASPECTQWSQANGKKPDLARILGGWSLFDDLDDDLKLDEDAATRSRLLMFDVLRFIEHHRYRYAVIENVVDIARNPKYAAPWQAWQLGLRNLGYQFTVVSLNSMHAQAAGDPAPQSRDRIYVVAWRNDQHAPDLDAFMRPQGFCGRCARVVETFQAWKPNRSIGKYKQQYVYLCATPGCGTEVEPGFLPAAAAIDWSIPGKRIGDRDKDLAEKTRARIAAGIARYWRPFTLEAAGNTFERRPGVRTWPAHDHVLTALHTTASKALAVPAGGTRNDDARPLTDPHRTMTTRDTTALVAPSDAFMLDRRFEYRTRDLNEPMSTLTANDTTKALLHRPFIAELRGGGSTARSTADPMSTVTASGNHHALLAPYYGNSDTARTVDEPVGTLTTVDRYALIMRNNGGGAEMTTPAGSYLRTLTTAGHQSLITPGEIEAAAAQVDDCLFRMLEPHEVGAGMAFDRDYIVLGSRRDQVKGYGNAVTPPAARDLITCIAAAAA